MKVEVPFAKLILALLGITAATSAIDARIQKKKKKKIVLVVFQTMLHKQQL